MFSPIVILASEDGHPVFLEFKHPVAPPFRALVIFSCVDDAQHWLKEQPERATRDHQDGTHTPAWTGYRPIVVRSIAAIDNQYRQAYGQAMSVINMSDIMHLSQVVG